MSYRVAFHISTMRGSSARHQQLVEMPPSTPSSSRDNNQLLLKPLSNLFIYHSRRLTQSSFSPPCTTPWQRLLIPSRHLHGLEMMNWPARGVTCLVCFVCCRRMGGNNERRQRIRSRAAKWLELNGDYFGSYCASAGSIRTGVCAHIVPISSNSPIQSNWNTHSQHNTWTAPFLSLLFLHANSALPAGCKYRIFAAPRRDWVFFCVAFFWCVLWSVSLPPSSAADLHRYILLLDNAAMQEKSAFSMEAAR